MFLFFDKGIEVENTMMMNIQPTPYDKRESRNAEIIQLQD